MKQRSLNGGELAEFIKERQARSVRALVQAYGVTPRLVILKTAGNPVIDTYVRLKKAYADDIQVICDVKELADGAMTRRIGELNGDPSVHGVIVQLPLGDPSQTDTVVAAIAPAKDVDGLGSHEFYTSATATAIDWLLTGYNVDLKDKAIAIVGNGRLVGAPLAELWRGNGLEPAVYDVDTPDLADKLVNADIIVTATGHPGTVTSPMVKAGAAVVDAGTTSENGRLVGDAADDLRARDDISITPVRGGVGPLTIAVLLDNVIKAAEATV